MKGKICLVTGANSGIGKATAVGLAKQGATVVMVVRDLLRGDQALHEVQSASGSRDVRLLRADLSSPGEVRNLALSVHKQFGALHVLVNNAAIVPSRRQETREGFEMQFAVNHLAPFLLTGLLLDLMKKSGGGRVVNVSSKMHEKGKIDLADLQTKNQKYRQIQVYCDTKLANVLFTNELARRLQGSGVTANSLHPGVIATNIYRSVPQPFRSLMLLFMKSPEKGAETSLFLATDPGLGHMNGKYFVNKKETDVAPAAQDRDLSRGLWTKSEELLTDYLPNGAFPV